MKDRAASQACCKLPFKRANPAKAGRVELGHLASSRLVAALSPLVGEVLAATRLAFDNFAKATTRPCSAHKDAPGPPGVQAF